MSNRLYTYVGPAQIAIRAAGAPCGASITSPADVLRWARDTNQGARFIATFVIDAAGVLRLADRHSEHVACAGGGQVRAAGEMTLRLGDDILVEAVSNQSTGYCPEPESWPAVAQALADAGLGAPDGYSPALIFRRCPACGAKNIVKDGLFICGVCDAELPAHWNFDD